MGAVVFAFDNGRVHHRPWQNRELAEFYRAIDILGRAGLAVVPDMGVSDEGDPWFAFCRGDTGDVVVHFARIDGLLVATSIASKEIVRGAELRNIIEAVIRIQPLGLPVASADRRLFLHPAVILTAFIAAALAFAKQADAQEIHSTAAVKGAEPHAPFAKMFATLKAAAGEVFGAMPAASSDGDNAASDPAGLEASVTLAALMSAAMTVVGSAADTASYDSPSTDTALIAAVGPDEHSPLHSLAFSLLSQTDPSDAVAQQNHSSPAAWTFSPNWHGAGDTMPASATLALPVAAADFSTQPAISFLPPQPAPAHFAVFTDNVFDHVAAPPPHIGTITAAASGTSGGDQSSSVISETPDASHGVDLSTISPIALAVLLGTSPTDLANATSGAIPSLVGPESTPDASRTGTASPSADLASPPSSSSVSAATAAGSTTSVPGTPATIVIAPNPSEALGQLVDYGLSSHPINGTFAVSSTLAADLPIYTAEVPQPVRLIVFDSTAIDLPVFELTKGVVFVSDHELGVSPAQATPANLVTVDLASGGTMTLLGVVDTAHLTL